MTILVRTKDDQQYGIVTAVLAHDTYRVQCHGKLERVGPWLRACSLLKGHPKPSINQWVLIGYNYQDKKTGKIMKVYSDMAELRYLRDHAEEAEVPSSMYRQLSAQLEGANQDNSSDGR